MGMSGWKTDRKALVCGRMSCCRLGPWAGLAQGNPGDAHLGELVEYTLCVTFFIYVFACNVIFWLLLLVLGPRRTRGYGVSAKQPILPQPPGPKPGGFFCLFVHLFQES